MGACYVNVFLFLFMPFRQNFKERTAMHNFAPGWWTGAVTATHYITHHIPRLQPVGFLESLKAKKIYETFFFNANQIWRLFENIFLQTWLSPKDLTAQIGFVICGCLKRNAHPGVVKSVRADSLLLMYGFIEALVIRPCCCYGVGLERYLTVRLFGGWGNR